MPPKTSSKDVDETMLQIFLDKLQEHKEQQDAMHEVITNALRSIIDKLAGISTLPPQLPDPQSIPSSSHLTNPNPQSPTGQQPYIPPFPIPSPLPTAYPHLTHKFTHPPITPIYDPTSTLKFQTQLTLLNPFDGSELLDWLFQVEQFFQLYQVPPDQRIQLISFYMKETCFGPSCYENHQVELFKLRQTTTITAYQQQFEKLCNKIWGLSLEVILNCFISSLIHEIRCEVDVLRPHHIAEALGLAKLDSRPNFSRPQRPTYNQPFTHLPRPQTLNTTRPTPLQSTLPIKRLTTAQMQERIAQGLCYNCDEKFFGGHKCQPKLFWMLLVDDFGADPE
ncbi:hypothetical protein Lal_00014122 [Lupinus albus]|nr:hypothetical protein Lal_00014122 [Lupinus albus]